MARFWKRRHLLGVVSLNIRGFLRKYYYYLMVVALGLCLDALILPWQFIPALAVPAVLLVFSAEYGYRSASSLRSDDEQ